MVNIFIHSMLLWIMLLLSAGNVTANNRINIDGMTHPLLTYECNQAHDIILITHSLLNSTEAANFKYSEAEGKLSPWNLIDIEQHSGRDIITKTSQLIKTCKLSSGEYSVTIEPHLFSHNLAGSCGASISSAITITHNKHEILERTPLEQYCHGNVPVITRVAIFSKTGEIEVKRIPRYKFY